MKTQGRSRTKLAANRRSKKALGQILRAFRERLGYSQGELASELEVKLSTLGMWERGENPLPMGMLLRLADVAAQNGADYENDCLQLAREAGVTPPVELVLGRQRSWGTPQSSEPGDVVALPLLDPASGPFVEPIAGRYVELPARLIPEPKPTRTICVTNDGGMPFAAGGLAVIDQSTTDLDVLLDKELPVAIHYSLGAHLRCVPVPIGFPAIPGALVSLVLEDVPEGITPYEPFDSPVGKDPKNKTKRAGVWVGWLGRQRVGRRLEDARECVFLWTPGVPDLWGGGGLEVTEWYPSPHGSKPAKSELIAEGLHVLGRVVLWVPKWTPTDKGMLPKAKPRKGPK
jgi:transcriptional regulator with XRE-family HTH domain